MPNRLALNRRGAFRLAIAVLLVLALLFGAQRLLRPSPPAGATLTDLTSVDQLQAMFNADKGSSRLIVIVSPT